MIRSNDGSLDEVAVDRRPRWHRHCQADNLTHQHNLMLFLAIGTLALPKSPRAAAYVTGRVAALLDRAIALSRRGSRLGRDGRPGRPARIGE
jgi:hypothetical protein